MQNSNWQNLQAQDIVEKRVNLINEYLLKY